MQDHTKAFFQVWNRKEKANPINLMYRYLKVNVLCHARSSTVNSTATSLRENWKTVHHTEFSTAIAEIFVHHLIPYISHTSWAYEIGSIWNFMRVCKHMWHRPHYSNLWKFGNTSVRIFTHMKLFVITGKFWNILYLPWQLRFAPAWRTETQEDRRWLPEME